MRIGIDIGTHTARAAFLDAQGQVQFVQLAEGAALPALARQTMHGLEVGFAAERALVGNHETTVSGCTRLMGRAGQLPPALLTRLPYPVREAGGEALCNLLYDEVPAATIYGRIAQALVQAAAQIAPVESVVLTVPASAEDRFRVQARTALETLGIPVHRLVNQPAAALLALTRSAAGGSTPFARARRVAVLSCGGGTTEASIAERDGDGWRVVATAGDNMLGGDDMAWTVAEHLNARIRAAAGVDVFAVDDSRMAAHGLRTAAEEALCRLAEVHETTLTIDHGGGFGRDLVVAVRRTDIEEWLAPALAQIGRLCARARGAAPGRIDAVALIGDWAFLPVLRTTAAATLSIPVARTHLCEPETAAVAGAAILAADAAANVWDVTPYPLGINCYYGNEELLSPIIRANTSIPTPPAGTTGAHTEEYQTRFADQTHVRLDVLQYRGPLDGNPSGTGRVRPHECEKLGSWEFSGLSPASGQCAGFTVTFAIDADGILQLHARETATGHTLTAQVDRSIG